MTTTERDGSIVPAGPPLVAEMLVAALDTDWWDDPVMLGGWSLGAAAFEERLPAAALARRAASLEDRALELALEHARRDDVIVPGTALAAVRRVRDAATLLQEAALQAFSHGALRALQSEARVVRHELRNPIGTIRNALSLLRERTDATPSPGDRADAPDRLHAIAKRGTTAIEALIRERLSGASAADVILGRGVALEALVERSVRAVSERALASGVALRAVPAAQPNGPLVRAPGVDLVLRSTLVAAVRVAEFGTRVDVEELLGGDGRAWIRVRLERVAGRPRDILDETRELARLAGLSVSGSLDAEGVCVEGGAAAASAPE